MCSSITFSENRIIINEENFNTYMAAKLMQNVVDIYPAYSTKIVLDLKKVEQFSNSGVLVIRRLMDEFENLSVEGVRESILNN